MKIETKESILAPERLTINNTENNILLDWLNYYESLDSTFTIENFFLERSDTLNFIQGNVFGNFDEEFDKIYNDFIVFSPNKKSYIDFDSYQWSIDKNNTPVFSPDQEINLIDLVNRTVTRIGFNGPLQWTENVYWKNDTTVVLLENTSEMIPRISELNIVNRLQKTFKYQDPLIVKSNYSELRLISKGFKIE